MSLSTANTLEIVAVACETVANAARDVKVNAAFTLKKTNLGGKEGFRFVQVVAINGEHFEVQVRKIPAL